jgi:hypothetical protein
MMWQRSTQQAVQDLITDNARMVGVAFSAYLAEWYDVPNATAAA